MPPVSELVVHHVVAAFGMARRRQGGVPGDQDRPVEEGLTGKRGRRVAFDAVADDVPAAADHRGRVDDDRAHVPVPLVTEPQHQQRGLGGDGDLHVLAGFEPGGGLEGLRGQEDAHEVLEAGSLVGVQFVPPAQPVGSEAGSMHLNGVGPELG